MEKHSESRLSYLFAHLHLLSSDSFSSTLLSSNLSLLSDPFHLCFSSVHIVGSLTFKLPSIILCIFIYIYRERERDIYIYIYIFHPDLAIRLTHKSYQISHFSPGSGLRRLALSRCQLLRTTRPSATASPGPGPRALEDELRRKTQQSLEPWKNMGKHGSMKILLLLFIVIII